jgi:hypothetical protein
MRLGHMSHHGMTDLMKRNLLKGCTSSKIKFCEHCIFGKHKRVQFNTSIHTTKGTLDYVRADLWGIKGYKLWNPETGKTFMSRSVVFNESVMFTNSLPSERVPEKKLQRMRIQVEHVDDDIGVQVEPADEQDDHNNDVTNNDAHDDVQQTPPILQLEEELPIAQRKLKSTVVPPQRLIEECNLSYYALSCAKQVENVHEPATYKEAVLVLIVRIGFLLCMRRCSLLRRTVHGRLFLCLRKRRP